MTKNNVGQRIECPKCGELISIDDVLSKQIEEKLLKEIEKDQKIREEEFVLLREEVEKQALENEKNKKQIERMVDKKVAGKLESEKVKLWKEVKAEIEDEQSGKMVLLEEQLKSKDKKLAEATKNEIKLLEEKNKLEEDKQTFELEKMRQIEEEKKKIFEEASKKADEEQHYVIAQLKKQLSDATKAKDDLARKLEQGSQQTQGEVLELELEDTLKNNFPYDEIEPVGKGVRGADIIQKVIDRSGRLCGQIVWESKKTKTWQENWIQKLKDDQRKKKAELAVIVSAVVPEGVEGALFKDGIWICEVSYVIALAMALRMNLEAVTREKSISVGKNEKMEVLYTYLTGVEFRQRVETIVEAFSKMSEGLRKEKMAYEKIWAEREKQINYVVNNTVGMYGDLSGLVSLPPIKNLELGEGE